MIVALLVGAGWGLLQATRAQVGPVFLLYVFPALLSIPLVPWLAYRLYTLQNSAYILERDAVQLQWGWRAETIPTYDILWVRPAADLEIPLRLPFLRWPGAMLGSSRLPDSRPVEFLASQSNKLILIGTHERAFAISPNQPDAFIQTYQQLFELGSLNPSSPKTVYPGFLFALVWRAIPARVLLLLGAILSLTLLIWVSLSIPSRAQIALGFTPNGLPRDPLPSIQLMFLPVFSIFIYLLNSGLGFFFYREQENRPWAYMLWSTSVLIGILFILATAFILRTG